MSSDPRVLFIGSTRRGFLALESLVQAGITVSGIISLRQDAHEFDRAEADFFALARTKDIPLKEIKSFREAEILDWIRMEAKPSLQIVVGCRVLLPKEIYEFPKFGTVAVHDSLLPKYRGFAPLNWAIINGEKVTGVSLFYLSEGMDEGDVVAQKAIAIGESEPAASIYEKSIDATREVLLGGVPKILRGEALPIKQIASEATYTCKRTPEDGLIKWEDSSRKIYDLVRGLSKPFPGAFTYLEGRKLTVWSATPVSSPRQFVGRIEGRVLGICPKSQGVEVLTGDGIIVLHEVEIEGLAEVRPARDILRSVKIKLGRS